MHKRIVASFALALAACAPAQPPLPAPPAIESADVSSLTTLMQLEDTRTLDVAALSRIASSPKTFLRARAMISAGRIGDRAADSLLLRGLADPSDSVRAAAAFALGELGDSSSAVVNALGALSSSNGQGAAESLHALGKIGGAAARTFVEGALRTRQTGPELQEALLAVWHFPRRPETNALIKQFTSATDPEIRWRAVYALVRGGPDPADGNLFMQALLHDADPLVRALAARGLRAATVDSAHFRPEGSVALQSATRDTDAHVRINAVSVLGGYRDSTYSGTAAALLTDVDRNVRIAATQALGLLKGSVAAAALEARARGTSENSTIRGYALMGLVQADAARGIAAATGLSTSSDWILRLYSARALSNARSPDAIALLRTLAADANARVAAPAIASLANIAGDTLQGLRALFIEKLAAPDVYVRAEALAGLEHLAGPGDEAVALDAFEHALQDSSEDAAVAAIGVLARLAKQNPAIERTFTERFPLRRIPLQEVQRAAIKEFKLQDKCCALTVRPAAYDSAVRETLLPALRSAHNPRARITTAGGVIEIELLAKDAPLTVQNFVKLAERRYFNGSRWHRVVPNFVLQDGDPTGTGNGGPGYAIRDEINPVRYLRGAVGMALSGPDTGGSQFFITHSPQPHLDGGYTVFGRVVTGMAVADRVIQDDAIVSIEIIR